MAHAKRFDLAGLPDAELSALGSAVMAERLSRAVGNGDPDVIVREAMQTMFSSSGEPMPPKAITPSLILMAGSVINSSAKKHTCKLLTTKLPDEGPETWMWDENSPTLIHGDSELVGSTRRSISLHTATDGMIMVQHAMTKIGDARHTRNACRAWRVELAHDSATGEILGCEVVGIPGWTPSHLPPPHTAEDTRSYAVQARR